MELKNNSVRLFFWLNFHQCLIISLLWCMLSTSTVLGLREQHNYEDAFQQHAKKESYVVAQSRVSFTCISIYFKIISKTVISSLLLDFPKPCILTESCTAVEHLVVLDV